MDARAEIVAAILHDARGCDHPYPCPFCRWEKDDMPLDESGCEWWAEKIVAALDQRVAGPDK